MLKCVIFDLDDTLCDEADYYHSGLTVVAAAIADRYHVNKERVFDLLWAEFNAGNRRRTFNAALEKLNLQYDAPTIAELIDTLRNHTPTLTLPPDSKRLLELLRPRYKLALLTDGFLPAQQLKVHSLGLEKCFDYILYTEKLGREYWKPAKKGFETVLQAMNISPSQACYIGDNAEKDFIAPNALGMTSIQFHRQNPLHTTPPPDENAKPAYKVDTLADLPTLLENLDSATAARSAPKATRTYRLCKRLLDLAIAIPVTIAALPLLALIALGIKLSSPGPVLFKQQRAGILARPFTLLKFRTMRTGTDPFGSSPKSAADPRLTAIGKILREHSLDELPQLFNVLAGQMSLVGPRPLYISQIPEWDDHQKTRLLVPPGLTGLAQISGRGRLTREQKLDLDAKYVQQAGLATDLKILLATIKTVLTRSNIYEGRYSETEHTRNTGN